MKNRKKSGFSLVENMISCLVLATLSLGGSAAIFQTTSGITEQQVMRAAVEIANYKLENARSHPYFFLAPGTFDESDRFYLSWVEKSYEAEYEIDPITGETNSVKMVKMFEPGIVDVGSGGTPPETTTTVDGIQY
ncbi:MAG TPA: type II secretion system protein, partial [Pontiella sp.]